jgi:hypothetical protein
MRVIGIDPSLQNTAIAVVQDHPGIEGFYQIQTKHINELEIGGYTEAIREFQKIPDSPIVAGFVEDFSGSTGGKWDKNSIAVVNRSGGMAEEALYACGIPIQPITVRQWRKEVLGKAHAHPTKSGRMMSYWTKGDKATKVPDNLTPALIKFFNKHLQLEQKADYSKLVFGRAKQKFAPVHSFEEALRFIELAQPTSRRIQLTFGVSTDELEAAGIALAGLMQIKSGKLTL